jgi:ArsR family transcriptional regulator
MGSSWKAIADDNRRQMLLLLKDGEKTPTEMAKSFEFTLPAVSTHLRVLKDAGLVSERKVGQNRFYSVNKERAREALKVASSKLPRSKNSLLMENKKYRRLITSLHTATYYNNFFRICGLQHFKLNLFVFYVCKIL